MATTASMTTRSIRPPSSSTGSKSLSPARTSSTLPQRGRKRETAKANLCPHQGATGDRRAPHLLRPARHDQQGPPRQDVRRGCQLLDPLRPDLNHRICLMDRTDVAIRISRMLATSQSGLLRTLTGRRKRVPIEQSFRSASGASPPHRTDHPSAAFPPTLISVANASSARQPQPHKVIDFVRVNFLKHPPQPGAVGQVG